MKNLIMVLLAAASVMGAVNSASAEDARWGRAHCVSAENTGRSNVTLVKHCSHYIDGDGYVLNGHHEDSKWRDAYSWGQWDKTDTKVVLSDSYLSSNQERFSDLNVTNPSFDFTRQVKVGGKWYDSLRTHKYLYADRDYDTRTEAFATADWTIHKEDGTKVYKPLKDYKKIYKTYQGEVRNNNAK